MIVVQNRIHRSARALATLSLTAFIVVAGAGCAADSEGGDDTAEGESALTATTMLPVLPVAREDYFTIGGMSERTLSKTPLANTIESWSIDVSTVRMAACKATSCTTVESMPTVLLNHNIKVVTVQGSTFPLNESKTLVATSVRRFPDPSGGEAFELSGVGFAISAVGGRLTLVSYTLDPKFLPLKGRKLRNAVPAPFEYRSFAAVATSDVSFDNVSAPVVPTPDTPSGMKVLADDKEFGGAITLVCLGGATTYGGLALLPKQCRLHTKGRLVGASPSTNRVQAVIGGKKAEAMFQALPGTGAVRGFKSAAASLTCTLAGGGSCVAVASGPLH